MGKVGKFVDDKSYRAVALQVFEELYEHLNSAKKCGYALPQVEILVKSSSEHRIVIPAENADEIIELLKLSLDDE